MEQIRVTIWNEFVHERNQAAVASIYPDGIHGILADTLGRNQDMKIQTATLDMPEHGLSQEVLEGTDVLIWWGHAAHDRVSDEVVCRVHQRVLSGMGLVVLHSGHYSKIFKKLMGTTCALTWREAGERERVWVVNPGHPVAQGLGRYFELECSEMYGEPFGIPEPDHLVFVSWFQGGEVFRSGACWQRGNGKVFYFSPGHETYPIYKNPNVQRVITNGVRWARPTGVAPAFTGPIAPELAPEPITTIRGGSVHGEGGRL